MGPPEVVAEENPPPPEVVVEEDPPEVDAEEDPLRSGCGGGSPRSGHKRGPPPPPEVVVEEDQLRSPTGQAGGMPYKKGFLVLQLQ